MFWATDTDAEIEEGLRAAMLAERLAPDDPVALMNAAIASINLGGDRARAIEWLDRALALNPNSAMALGGGAIARNYDGDYVVAADNAQRALRLSPFDPIAHVFLYACGCSHLLRRAPSEAIQWLRRSIQVNSQLPHAHVYLASALAHSGQFDEASATISRLMKMHPISGDELQRVRRKYCVPEDFDFMLAGARLAGLPE